MTSLNIINQLSTKKSATKCDGKGNTERPSLHNTSKSRNWCFTSYEEKLPKFEDIKRCTYLIYQGEECPSTGKPHWQGFCQFEDCIRMTTVKSRLKDKKIHLEIPKGTVKDNIKYCSKPESRIIGPFTYGKPKYQGQRNDISDMIETVIEDPNISIKSLALGFEGTWTRNYKAIEKVRESCLEEKAREFRNVEVELLIGKPRQGKSRYALYREKNPNIMDKDIYRITQPDGERLWWDGYNGEKTIVIDDFDGWIKYKKLLVLLEGHKLMLEKKGGFTYAQYTKVIITANNEIEEWYPRQSSKDGCAALKARITSYKDM